MSVGFVPSVQRTIVKSNSGPSALTNAPNITFGSPYLDNRATSAENLFDQGVKYHEIATRFSKYDPVKNPNKEKVTERMIKGLFKKLNLQRNTGEWTKNKKNKKAMKHFQNHGDVDILNR